jgi:hypothetical protein
VVGLVGRLAELGPSGRRVVDLGCLRHVGMLNVASSWSRQLDVFVVGGNGSLYYATSLDGSTVQSWTEVGDLGTGGGLGFGTGSTAYAPTWLSAFSTAPNGSVLHAYRANATSLWAYESWGQASGTNLYNEDIGAATIDPGWLAIDAFASGAAQEKGWYVFNQGSWVNAGSPSMGLDDWVELSTW